MCGNGWRGGATVVNHPIQWQAYGAFGPINTRIRSKSLTGALSAKSHPPPCRTRFPEFWTHGKSFIVSASAALRLRTGQPGQGGRAERRRRYHRSRMGNPDLPTPAHVIDKLKDTLASRGPTATPRHAASPACARRKPPITTAASGQAQSRNPGSGDAGSKEGFANVAQAITAPGDVVLCRTRAIRSMRLDF